MLWIADTLILRQLGSSSLMAILTEADLHGPLASQSRQYLDTATASRQVLYERYFGGDVLRTMLILYSFYDRKPMT